MSEAQLTAALRSHAATKAGRIADPGNAGAIGVGEAMSGFMSCRLKTAAAETRTVAAPTAPGLLLHLYMGVDGGDCVVTFASAINTAGTTVVTFDDVYDHVLLLSEEGAEGTYVWRVIHSDGATGTGVQGTALTAQLTSITIADAHTTPDYAIAATTNTNAYGFAGANECISFLYVVQNLQVRMAEVEARLEGLGLVAAN